MTIHSSGLFLVSPTYKASHWVQMRRHEIAGRANGMGLDQIHKFGERTKGCAVGVYRTGFGAGNFTGIDARDRSGGQGLSLVLTKIWPGLKGWQKVIVGKWRSYL